MRFANSGFYFTPTPVTATPGPLTGVKALEMCTGIGGLTAGALLTGLGADVSQVVAQGAVDAADPLPCVGRSW